MFKILKMHGWVWLVYCMRLALTHGVTSGFFSCTKDYKSVPSNFFLDSFPARSVFSCATYCQRDPNCYGYNLQRISGSTYAWFCDLLDVLDYPMNQYHVPGAVNCGMYCMFAC